MSRPVLTESQVREVARRYDGTTATIDALVSEFRCRRHHVHKAAQRGGYTPRRKRIEWTPEADAYLEEHYGLVPVSELCQALDCSPAAINNRRKRLGLSAWDRSREIGYNVREIEDLTGLDHRIQRRFMDAGELRETPLWVGDAEPCARSVTIEDLHRFLRRRPEVVDYRNATFTARVALELDRLPDPPRYKRLTCRSRNFDRNREYNDGIRKRSNGRLRSDLPSCAERPFSFWVPTYESHPLCPRCGSHVTPYSEKRQYRDDEPDDSEVLRMLAGKLGLRYSRGRVRDRRGRSLEDEDLVRYAFNSGRNPHAAFQTFRKLLETGLSPVRARPAARSRILQPLVDYGLLERQRTEWRRFLRESNIGVYWPPGEGKMFFGAWAASRIPGRHLILVNTATLRDQWARFFAAHCRYGADAVELKSPHGRLVRVYDRDGHVRCTIEILTYATRADLSAELFELVIFDEAHYLPGNRAHRFALAPARYRIGMTGTPYREDGRAGLLDMLIGQGDSASWSEILADRQRPAPPIRVCVVDDQEAKLREAGNRISGRRRGIVFIERISEGRELARRTGLPFIHGETSARRRLEVLRDNRRVIMSRVGDHGLDVQDLQFVVEFGFFRGSRMQQLQRYGRLLHATGRSHYLILMTREEFSRHAKRLSALEEQGLRFRISVIGQGDEHTPKRRTRRRAAGMRDLLAMIEGRATA